MIDFQEPPAIVIHIPDEKHVVGEEVVEYVARLLARAAGEDPDHDDRCGPQLTLGSLGGYVTCDLNPFAKPHWRAYRERAIEVLRATFGRPSP